MRSRVHMLNICLPWLILDRSNISWKLKCTYNYNSVVFKDGTPNYKHRCFDLLHDLFNFLNKHSSFIPWLWSTNVHHWICQLFPLFSCLQYFFVWPDLNAKYLKLFIFHNFFQSVNYDIQRFHSQQLWYTRFHSQQLGYTTLSITSTRIYNAFTHIN